MTVPWPDVNVWIALIVVGWRGLTTNGIVGHNFWTDAYLAAFAEAAGFTLVTF